MAASTTASTWRDFSPRDCMSSAIGTAVLMPFLFASLGLVIGSFLSDALGGQKGLARKCDLPVGAVESGYVAVHG